MNTTERTIHQSELLPFRFKLLTPAGMAACNQAIKAEMKRRGVSLYPKAIRTDWGRIIKASFYDAAHEGLYWTWETVGGEETP